jgi:hypothetical protein
MGISIDTNHIYTYVGLRGPSGTTKSSTGPTNRKSFRGLTAGSLGLIPGFSPELASGIKVSEFSAKVPQFILDEGLRLLCERTPVFTLSSRWVPGSERSVPTFGELVKEFERSLALLKEPWPTGWLLHDDARSCEATHASVKRVIKLSEQGVTVKLSKKLAAPNLSLWFQIVNLLEGGHDEFLESYVPIPGLSVLDSAMADANGRSVK